MSWNTLNITFLGGDYMSVKKENEMYKAALKSRESSRFTQGILDAVE